MSDQIVDALMACAIHAIAARTHPLVGWIVMRNQPDYPDEMIGRLVADTPTPYVLGGHTLAEVQAQLPPGLERSERQPSDPPEVVEGGSLGSGLLSWENRKNGRVRSLAVRGNRYGVRRV